VRVDPTHYIWWLLSRSAGIVALTLVSFSVLLGLTMATKIVRRPGLGRKLVRLHEHLALVALSAMVVHGATLLGLHEHGDIGRRVEERDGRIARGQIGAVRDKRGVARRGGGGSRGSARPDL